MCQQYSRHAILEGNLSESAGDARVAQRYGECKFLRRMVGIRAADGLADRQVTRGLVHNRYGKPVVGHRQRAFHRSGFNRDLAVAFDCQVPGSILGQFITIRRFRFFQRIGTRPQSGKLDLTGNRVIRRDDGLTLGILQNKGSARQRISILVHLVDNDRRRLVLHQLIRVEASANDRHICAAGGLFQGFQCSIQCSIGHREIGGDESIATLPGFFADHIAIGCLGFFDQEIDRFRGKLIPAQFENTFAVGGHGDGIALVCTVGIEFRHGEHSTVKAGGMFCFGILAADLQDAHSGLIGIDAEGTALIGGADIEFDANGAAAAAFQRGRIVQLHILRTHGLGGFDLIGQLQGRFIGNVDGEALAILGHGQHIGAVGNRAALGHLHSGVQVGELEGVFQVHKHVLAIAHGVGKAEDAVVAQLQRKRIELQRIAYLIACGGDPFAGLVHSNVVQRNASRAGHVIQVAAIQHHGGAVLHPGESNGVGRGILVQRRLERTVLDDRVILDHHVIASTPPSRGLVKGKGKRILCGVPGEDCLGKIDGVIGTLLIDPEGILPVGAGRQQLQLRGQGIRHIDAALPVAEGCRADLQLPADLLNAVVVVILILGGIARQSLFDHRAELTFVLGNSRVGLQLDPADGVIELSRIFDVDAGRHVVRQILVVEIRIENIQRNIDGFEISAIRFTQRGSQGSRIKQDADLGRIRGILRQGIVGVLRQGDLCILGGGHDHRGEKAIGRKIKPDAGISILRNACFFGDRNNIAHFQRIQACNGDAVFVFQRHLPAGVSIMLFKAAALVNRGLFSRQANVLAQDRRRLAGDRSIRPAIARHGIGDFPIVFQQREIRSVLRRNGIVHQLELAGGKGGIILLQLAGHEGEGLVAIGIRAKGDIIRGILVPQLDDLHRVAGGHVPNIKRRRTIGQQNLPAVHGIDKFHVGAGDIPVKGHIPADQNALDAFLIVDRIIAGGVGFNAAHLVDPCGCIDGILHQGGYVRLDLAIDRNQRSLIGVFLLGRCVVPVEAGHQLLHRVRHVSGELQVIGAGGQHLFRRRSKRNGLFPAVDVGCYRYV